MICDITADLGAGPAAILSIYTGVMRRLAASSAHTVSMRARRLQADLAPLSVSGAQPTRSDS